MIYSDCKTAIAHTPDYVKLWECDVYVNEHHYPSGFEYSIDQRPGCICVFHCPLKFDHKFRPNRKGRRAAFEYAIKFEKQLNKVIFVKEIFEERNGYKFRECYILTDVEPEDTNE